MRIQLALSVVPAGGKWHVVLASAVLATTHLQKQAIAIARPLARKHRLELLVFNKRGLIRSRDSHGFDSPRRKG